MSPHKRPSFKAIHTNISEYTGHIGGYLEMGLNPFTSWGGKKHDLDTIGVAAGGHQVHDGAKCNVVTQPSNSSSV